MFRHLSKFTASTFKYTTSLFLQCNHDYSPTSASVELWLQEIQMGLDALLDDHIMESEDIFLQNKASPFHAFGYALIMYTKAMLSMETAKVQEAVNCVSGLETHIKRILHYKKKRKEPATTSATKSIPTSCSVPLDIQFEKHTLYDQEEYLYMQFELIYANCVLMLATLQFLRDSWIDHVKAAYDLRKAYKMYERMFEALTGMSILEYQTTTIAKAPSPPSRHSIKPTRRTVSCDDGRFIHQSSTTATTSVYHQTAENGAYFGIGLFHMIFSLLPCKVGKLLNNIGFHTCRSTALHLLRVAYNGKSMYSSLSALVLLTFYTNTTMYIQPSINRFFPYQDAAAILKKMQSKYPNGRLWHLIQGKFKRIEGNLTDAVALFTKAKEPHHARQEKEDSKPLDALDYFRNASINEFTQFRSFAIYETGWAHIYAGNYTLASEAFFCLESICNWSRLFYHYIATCCMMAEGMYDKAALESIQMINMFEQKRKLGHHISSNEHYAESKVASWIAMSSSTTTTPSNKALLKETLHTVTNPIWELVYLWHGTCYWTYEVISDIRSYAGNSRNNSDPMLSLIMGVVCRDVDRNLALAMEYFNLILMMKQEAAGWVYPYAMYEIAATQCALPANNTWNGGGTTLAVVVTDWVRCIEAYYQQHPQDKEWECRMQLRCQLLLESCCA